MGLQRCHQPYEFVSGSSDLALPTLNDQEGRRLFMPVYKEARLFHEVAPEESLEISIACLMSSIQTPWRQGHAILEQNS